MYYHKPFIGLIFIALLFVACKQDYDILLPEENGPGTGAGSVIAGISGILTDELGNGIADIDVSVDNLETLTDEFGAFFLPEKEYDNTPIVVEASALDFFPAYRRVEASQDGHFFSELFLVSKDVSGSFQNEEGGMIDLSDDVTLSFQAFSMLDTEGQVHEGNVQVAARWIPSTGTNFYDLLPGSLLGYTNQNEERALVSFGVLMLDIRSDQGELLQIGLGKEATMQVPVQGSLSGLVGATTPVWVFEPSSGTWEEQGSATFDGSTLSAEIGATQYWTIAKDYPVQNLETDIYAGILEPLGGKGILLDYQGLHGIGKFFTNQEGLLYAKVAGGLPLELRMEDDCGEEIYQRIIEPLDAATTLPPILIEGATVYPTSLSGTIQTCEGEPLEAGYALIETGEIRRFLFANDGVISSYLPECTDSMVLIRVVDQISGEISPALVFETTSQMDLGTLTACSFVPEFINFSLDGEDYSATTPNAYQEGGQTILEDAQTGISFIIDGEETGNYTILSAGLSVPGITNNDIETATVNLNATITQYGAPGEDIIGSFGGNFEENGGTMHTITGTFKVKRAF